MTTDLIGNKSIPELDAIINAATERKQAMYDGELERLLDEVEQRCEMLGITLAQLIAIAKKRRRKRAHKDNGESKE